MTSTEIAAIAVTVAIVIALFTMFIILLQNRELKRTIQDGVASRALEDLDSNEARTDEALVKSLTEETRPTEQSMKRALETMLQDTCISEANFLRPEAALERSILRFDRVGYLILGDKEKLSMDLPPAELWDRLENTWKWAEPWVAYRRTEASNKLHSPHYGRYFERLHLYYKNNKNTLYQRYTDADFWLNDVSI